MAIGTRKNTIRYAHQSNTLTDVTIRIGGEDYLAQLAIRPSTPTIYNVAINNDAWTAIAVGLTDVLSWRLSEASGKDFLFAFVAVPATQATAFGWIGEQSELTSIYAKRKDTGTNNMELVVWKI
jgi:hypothetical protein